MTGTPRFLYGPAVRHEIQKRFSGEVGAKRLAIAYIGNDAVECLGGRKAVRGALIYCWPQPGSTSPYGVKALIKAGAKVYFVQNLHAKVYWTSRNGAIVGSCNLSSNRTLEAGLVVASNVVNPKLWATLESRKLSRKDHGQVMKTLFRAWDAKNGRGAVGTSPRLKPKDWFAESDRQPVFVAGFNGYLELDDAIRSKLKEGGESTRLFDYCSCEIKVPKGTWLMGVHWVDTKRPSVNWMYCDGSISIGRKDWFTFQKKKRSDFPFAIGPVRKKVIRRMERLGRTFVGRLVTKEFKRGIARKLGFL